MHFDGGKKISCCRLRAEAWRRRGDGVAVAYSDEFVTVRCTPNPLQEFRKLVHTEITATIQKFRRCTQHCRMHAECTQNASAFCVQLREGGVQLHENSMLLRGSGVDAALWLRVAACSRHEGDVEAAGKMRGVCVEAACSGMDEAFGCTVCT